MKLLLDTQMFLWLGWDDPKLPAVVRAAFEDEQNEVFLSSVSAWEIGIKHGLGKLPLPTTVQEFVSALRAANGITSLPLDEDAAFALGKLPPAHRDPFDRILVAQAIVHGLVLATSDTNIRRYPVRTLP